MVEARSAVLRILCMQWDAEQDVEPQFGGVLRMEPSMLGRASSAPSHSMSSGDGDVVESSRLVDGLASLKKEN